MGFGGYFLALPPDHMLSGKLRILVLDKGDASYLDL